MISFKLNEAVFYTNRLLIAIILGDRIFMRGLILFA